MRHIPEPELHAYLDQALSRTQCVEIERHLAICAACHAARDEIAALRDRTTALLASLAPAVAHAPPFEVLRHRTAGALSARRRRRQQIAWAASVAGGIGLGWTAAMLFGGPQAVPAVSTAAPAAADTAGAVPETRESAPWAPVVSTGPRRAVAAAPSAAQPGPTPGGADSSPRSVATAPIKTDAGTAASPAGTPVATRPSGPDAGHGVTDSAHPAGDVVMSGAWKTVSWDSAQAEAGGKAPSHVDGLPVVQVQVQKNQSGERPTMVVAQQLASGEVIRTIEGPAADVSRLLGHRIMTDPEPDSSPPNPLAPTAGVVPRGAGQSMAMQRGNRMVVITGALPSDSLRAMMRRLHDGQVEQEPGTTPAAAPNGAAQSGPAAPARPTLPVPK